MQKTKVQSQFTRIPVAAEENGVTVPFLRKQIFLRKIPYYKVGRMVLLKRSDLLDWIERRKVEVR